MASFKSWFKRLTCNISKALITRKKLSQEIHKAFRVYDYEKLAALIKDLRTPDALNEFGETPLYIASINGSSSERDRQMVKFFIEKGADVLHYSHNGKITPAAHILQYNDQNLIELVLTKVEDINSPLDKYNNTALHLAVKKANKSTVLKLLERGANPNQKNSQKRAAMHEAVTAKGCELLELLVSYGGDINIRGNRDYTPLHLATLSQLDIAESSERTLAGFPDEKEPGRILDKVLELHPNMNARDSTRNTALAIYMLHSRIVYESVVNKYINAGTNPSLLDQTGMNVLHRLVYRNTCLEPDNLVGNLINGGVGIEDCTYYCEDTVLHIAAAFGLSKFIYILLSKSANLFAENIRGRTPMDLAVFAENIEAIEIMYSFAIRWNLPLDSLMLMTEHHSTRDFYRTVMNIRERAQIEYDRCKKMRLYSPWRIFYSDLLFMEERKFAKLLKNKKLSSNFTANLIDLRAFGYSYKIVYNAARTRRDAEDAAVLYLQKIWNYGIPVECIEKIVDHMITEDLIVFLTTKC